MGSAPESVNRDEHKRSQGRHCVVRQEDDARWRGEVIHTGQTDYLPPGMLDLVFFGVRPSGTEFSWVSISVGVLVPSDRPVLALLRVRLLVKYPMSLALPRTSRGFL
jgi:hypothetical protein